MALQERNQNTGHKIKMIWEKNESLNCSFEDLFEPLPQVELIQSSKILDYFLFYKHRPQRSLKSIIKKLLLGHNSIFFDDDKVISLRTDKKYWDKATCDFALHTCQDFYVNEVKNYYQLFKPVKHLQIKIDAEVKKLFLPATGIHIRRTDNIHSIEKSTTKAFSCYIESSLLADSNQIFYLATDDLEVEKNFKNSFGKHIVAMANKDLRRNSQKGIEDALIDLYVLSNTRKIIGSYWSSYSRIAAQINHIPLHIIE